MSPRLVALSALAGSVLAAACSGNSTNGSSTTSQVLHRTSTANGSGTGGSAGQTTGGATNGGASGSNSGCLGTTGGVGNTTGNLPCNGNCPLTQGAPGQMFCAPDNTTCVACLSNQQCPANQMLCITDAGAKFGQCVVCLQNGDCQGSEVCDPITNLCSADCNLQNTCSTPLPYCEPDAGACVACLTGPDCGLLACKHNQCTPCTSNADCADYPNQSTCHIADGDCLPCQQTSTCDGG